jgi:hypothetical protein
MTVDEERGSGHEAGMHGQGFAGVELDQNEALPTGTVSFDVGLELVEEGLLELQDFSHVHADDEWFGGCDGGVGEDHIFEIVAGGGKDGGALIDLSGIEQVKNGKVLDMEDLVHTFEAKSAFTVEKVGDMSLFKSGLLSEAESG